MPLASDRLPNFTGCIFDGRYELTKMLGSGTYGVVYKAVDLRADAESDSRFRAIKIIKKAGRTPAEIDNVRREVTLHGFVSDHPSVVTLHDCIEDDKYFYIILEYIAGGDLFDQISSKELYINNDELLRGAFLSLLDAVEACHTLQIAHRDIKPENILTTADGSKVFLADFGLAITKRMAEDHGAGTSIYMAPECFNSTAGPYCPRTADIWALGVILANMISSRNPWQKAVRKDKGFSRYVDDHTTLFELLPISEEAYTILRRIFTIDPLRRITLPKLRKAIQNVQTFFRPADVKVDVQVETQAVVGMPTKMQTLVNEAFEFETLGQELGLLYQHRPHTTIGVEYLIALPELSPSSTRSSSQDSDTESSGAITPPEGQSAVPKDLKSVDKSGSMAHIAMAQYHLSALGFE